MIDALSEKLPQQLLPWYEKNARPLPWRQNTEPYHIWLSEIMLQQTRVEAVKGYYARFLAACPTIEALAQADDDQLNKLWEGLGYYTRVRNLKKAAIQIMTQYGGIFPQDYASVRALAGIGDYTAGAICSICFEQPTPAVDGNVLRVVTRLTEDPSPINQEKTKQNVKKMLAAIYPQTHRGHFTQSLIELGATVCLPNSAPNCEECPCREICGAAQHGTWREFPVKEPKRARKVEEKTVFVLTCGGSLAVRKRKEKGLLHGLWEFPNVGGLLETAEALQTVQTWGVQPTELQRSVERVHLFTHVQWNLRCYYIVCREMAPMFVWANRQLLDTEIALPTAFRMFRPDDHAVF